MSWAKDDERPKPIQVHIIGQDLSELSVTELDERILLLRAEIVRLEADKSQKEASKTAASAFFKL